MVLDGPPAVTPDPAVRRVRRDELETLLPACIAMFTEEIGVSPLVGDGGALYRARVAELVSQGRAYARIEDGRVLFKAEVGAATRSVCQVQGVWVHPSLRGRGLSVGGTAAAATLARTSVAPVVSLYVNDFNTPARRAYERVGFRQVATFTSVLF
jgi:predicted GNAT family acetyltransferase